MQFNMQSATITGRGKLIVTDASGKVKLETDFQDNDVLSSWVSYVGTYPDQIKPAQWMKVGSSQTPNSAGITTIQSLLSYAGGLAETEVDTGSYDAPTRTLSCTTHGKWSFPLGAVNGTVWEIGLGLTSVYKNANVQTRIVLESGIPVTTDDQLSVIYERTASMVLPEDGTFNVSVNGVNTAFNVTWGAWPENVKFYDLAWHILHALPAYFSAVGALNANNHYSSDTEYPNITTNVTNDVLTTIMNFDTTKPLYLNGVVGSMMFGYPGWLYADFGSGIPKAAGQAMRVTIAQDLKTLSPFTAA